MSNELFDVVAVNITTKRVRLLAEHKTKRNAEAIVNMAVIRIGVDEEFYAPVLAGKYKDGDEWTGGEA